MDFTIPKGSDFDFTIEVKNDDGIGAKDLTTFSNGTFTVYETATGVVVTTVAVSVLDALNGIIAGTIPAATTSLLEVLRGDEVDDFYLKSYLEGFLKVEFSDMPDITATMPKIYVNYGA